MVVSTDQFSICVFLSKQGAKLKSERVSWLSKIWALYFMTDLGSILSFLISGFNNTEVLCTTLKLCKINVCHMYRHTIWSHGDADSSSW